MFLGGEGVVMMKSHRKINVFWGGPEAGNKKKIIKGLRALAIPEEMHENKRNFLEVRQP